MELGSDWILTHLLCIDFFLSSFSIFSSSQFQFFPLLSFHFSHSTRFKCSPIAMKIPEPVHAEATIPYLNGHCIESLWISPITATFIISVCRYVFFCSLACHANYDTCENVALLFDSKLCAVDGFCCVRRQTNQSHAIRVEATVLVVSFTRRTSRRGKLHAKSHSNHAIVPSYHRWMSASLYLFCLKTGVFNYD